MKKLLVLVLTLVGTFPLFAESINDISVKATLREDGSALIEERWDVVTSKGTEWYLVRENLGDIRITGLSVTDENGTAFLNEGSWDVDRSITQKAGRCGLHYTSEGVEICWGIGSYGPHVWTVSYVMTNAVKSLQDSDMLHIQFISDELSASPAHASVTLQAPVSLSEENSRIWGFGYNGEVGWQDGRVVAEASDGLGRNASMILLVRFDKGIFSSASVQDRDFQAVLDRARVGAYYPDEDKDDEEEDPVADAIATIAMMLVSWWAFIKPLLRIMGIVKKEDRRRMKQIFGRRRLPLKPDWSRDIPFDGNYMRTYYIASHLKGYDDGKLSAIPAILLRMLGHGNLEIREDDKGKKEFHFKAGASREWMSKAEKDFYKLLVEASGSDIILQEKEFKSWASKHSTEIKKWVTDFKDEVRISLSGRSISSSSAYYDSIVLTPEGQAKAMQALGFRQFLKDFTIINERHAPEVTLWGEYLVVAALFGMADKVASDMKRLAPEIKLGDVQVRTASLGDLVYLSNSFRNSTSSSYSSAMAASSGGSYGSGSSGGWGGHSSFGGGGGFSGGGHGGGSR